MKYNNNNTILIKETIYKLDVFKFYYRRFYLQRQKRLRRDLSLRVKQPPVSSKFI